MYAKLALRNLKRQTSSYIIYFITVVFTVSLLFAVNNVLFSDELWAFCALVADERILPIILTVVISLVTVVVCVIICYATAFLLRRRKKEFGTYLLLGIKRLSVMSMFVVENVVIGVISFACGCLLGIGVFEVLNAVICAMIGNRIAPLMLSVDSLPVTLAQWAGIFVIALLISSLILRRTKINQMLKGQNVEKKWPRRTFVEMIAAIVMLCAIVADAVFVLWIIDNLYESYNLDAINFTIAVVPVAVVALIVTIFVFYLCLRSIYIRRLKYKKVKAERAAPSADIATLPLSSAASTIMPDENSPSLPLRPETFESRKYRRRTLKGSNIFHYRQMSGAMNRNAALMGIIAVLISFAVIASIITFSLRIITLAQIPNPFDITGEWDAATNGDGQPEDDYYNVGTPEEALEDARKYTEVEFSYIFQTYQPDTSRQMFDRQYLVVSVGDVNAITSVLGLREFRIDDDEYYMINDDLDPVSGGALSLYGRKLRFAGSVSAYEQDVLGVREVLNQNAVYDFYVVPDAILTDAVKEEYVESRYLVMNTADYLPEVYYEKFTYRGGGCKLESRFREIDTVNMQFSVIIVSALFLGMTFMLIAMALLSLKVMADADLDKRRYAILNMLGVGAGRQRLILLRQLFAFFSLPLLIPLLLVAPTIVAGTMMSHYILGYAHASIGIVGAVVPLVYLGVYLCYFAATYFLSVVSLIKPLEKPRVKLLSAKKEA